MPFVEERSRRIEHMAKTRKQSAEAQVLDPPTTAALLRTPASGLPQVRPAASASARGHKGEIPGMRKASW